VACAETPSHSRGLSNIRVRVRVSFTTGAVRSAILATAGSCSVPAYPGCPGIERPLNGCSSSSSSSSGGGGSSSLKGGLGESSIIHHLYDVFFFLNLYVKLVTSNRLCSQTESR